MEISKEEIFIVHVQLLMIFINPGKFIMTSLSAEYFEDGMPLSCDKAIV